MNTDNQGRQINSDKQAWAAPRWLTGQAIRWGGLQRRDLVGQAPIVGTTWSPPSICLVWLLVL